MEDFPGRVYCYRQIVYFTNLEAVDNNKVFAFSTTKNIVVSTRNGGNSSLDWTKLSLPQPALSYLFFISDNVGWVSVYNDNDNKYYIYKTTDRVTWTAMNDPVVNFSSHKMKFVNDTTGYALGFISGGISSFGQNTVFKTTDGGRIWEPLPRDNNFSYLGYTHNDLHFWNESQLWAGGGHGFLEMSTNGGGTPLPKAYFKIDLSNLASTNTVQLVNLSKSGYQYKCIKIMYC